MTRLIASDWALPSTAALKPVLTRTFLCAFLSTGLVACATAPSKSGSEATAPIALTPEFSSASGDFKARRYSDSVKKFDAIIDDPETPSNERRLAHLGKALVYLSYDEDWRSLKSARAALGNAARVPVPQGEKLDIETDLLMESILAQIDSQTAYESMKSKTGDSGYQIAQLKKSKQALEQERDALVKENANLNNALEKLKNLTLGN